MDSEVRNTITLLDLKRLESYSSNLIEFYMIRDLIPAVARLYFMKSLDVQCKLSKGQAVILLGLGLQLKDIDNIVKEMDVPANQALALFNKSIKRVAKYIRLVFEKEVREEIDLAARGKDMMPLKNDLGKDMEKEGKKVLKNNDIDGAMLKKRRKNKEDKK